MIEQTRFIRRVQSLFTLTNNRQARPSPARTAADRLTPALLAKAFCGELVSHDQNDKPAAELLKRLAARTWPASEGGRLRT